MKCNTCGIEFNEADLSEVFKHEHVGIEFLAELKYVNELVEGINNNFEMKDYKVIEGYPDSPFLKGDILKWDGVVYGTGEPQKFIRHPENYPKIFEVINN